MKLLLTFLLLGFGNCVIAQDKKLAKLFAADYKRVDATKSYPFNETDSRITIVPSNTYRGDTSGIVYNNEFVNFRFNRMKLADEQTYYRSHFDGTRNVTSLIPFDTVVPPPHLIRYVKEQPVSVAEFLEFQHWVRDSIARDLLYENVTYLKDKEANKMLLHGNLYEDAEYLEMAEYDPSDRQLNRALFPLNWDYKVEYNNYTRTELEDLYISSDEWFCGKIEFDQRKLNYAYGELAHMPLPMRNTVRGHKNRMRYFVSYKTPTLVDTYSWMNLAQRQQLSFDIPKMNRKEWEVLSQLYLDQFPDAPIIGITGMQARAYCDWKEMRIRAAVNEAELPYNVEVSIVSVEDLNGLEPIGSFNIPEYNPTENWRITAEEYGDFIEAVRDSILNDGLYYAISDPIDVVQLVNYQKQFPKESVSSVAYLYYGEENKKRNRKEYPLTYNHSIQRKYRSLADSIRQTETYKNPYFDYAYMNEYQRSIVGTLEAQSETGLLEVVSTDSIPHFVGMDLNLGYENDRGQSSGVRSHKYLKTLYITETISILPGVDLSTQKKNAAVLGITYDQALAFYAWKYPIHKASFKDDWLRYVVPTQEEFEKVQRGEEIIVPAKEVTYPTPTFRYVIHLIPYEDEDDE